MRTVYEVMQTLLDAELHPYFENATLLKEPVYHSRRNELELAIQLQKNLPYTVFIQMQDQLRLRLHTSINLELKSQNTHTDVDDIGMYIAWAVSRDPALHVFYGMHPSVNQNQEITYSTSVPSRKAAMQEAIPRLVHTLQKAGLDLPVVIHLQEEPEDVAMIHVSLPEHEQRPVQPERPRRSWKQQPPADVQLRDLEVGMEHVRVKGHIFDLDTRELRSGKLMQLVYLSDYQDALIAKRFEGKSFSREDMQQLSKGQSVMLTGDVVFDNSSRTNVLMIRNIEPFHEPKRKDNAEQKRIEMHIHTTFSEMDGVCAVEEYLQTAWDWGMDAIAITDHNVVQAFPMAQHKLEALKKSDPEREFKVLYGCEMTMVDTDYKLVYNNSHRLLEDETFVVFDTETTGLSSRMDRIIEFGAVKMKDREVIDTRQFFINPQRTIPANITSLTHINQSDVDMARPMSEMFDEIVEFCQGCTLVAHNAVFDMGMLNEEARRLGRPAFDNPVIDTLPMAYAMMDLKSYRLGSVCKHYGVAYDGDGAHRADYDARVLSEVFQHMLNALGPEATMDTIASLEPRGALRKNHGYHITVMARNKEGLKDLFELVTLSHTRYLSYNPNGNPNNTTGQPRIPREELQKAHAKGNLLFGSSCQNGELFELAHTRSEAILKEAMQFYDYVEIQPLEVYKNLLDRQSIENKAALQQILTFLMDAADDLGIPLVADGDCHYVHPHESRIRDIYINAKAIGNSRHPLYKYNLQKRRSQSNPLQYFLTTDEMLKAFSWVPEERARRMVLDNPRKIADQIEPVYPIKDKLYPPDIDGSDQKLRDICYQTAREWYGDPLPKPVEERLEKELKAIIGAGYYVVYYISHLLVKKSNDDGYLVGSRGSVGSSFVATMSGITEVNPLPPHYICRKCHHLEWNEDENIHSGFDLPDKICPECGEVMRGDGQDIPFETFLGFEGDKVPDIDLNFSGEYQPNAHLFTRSIFGADHVFKAGTVGTVQEKTAYGYVKGYEEELELEPFSEAKRTDLAKGCEGVKRTTGQHPGGIVVVPADMDIHDFTPVQYPANNPYAEWRTTHFDFHQIHDNILKFDILGHVDPTAMKMMERMSGIDVRTIPMNDPETMKIFSSTESLKLDRTQYDQITGAAGIPEYGTPFVRGILELTKPTTFAELVSISGLSHGTDVWLNNAKDLIDNGTCNLREVIGCRDDIMVDLIRYGLPSKDSFTIMESVRKGKGLKPEWEEEMRENQVPEWYIDSCKKIKYMFPKAHAVAYVMMAVRSAWFKVHMPLIYYCQYFSIRCDAYDIHTMIQGKDAIQKRMEGIQLARADKTQKIADKELAIYDTLELALEMAMRGYHFSNMSITRSAATEFRVDPDDPRAIIPPFTALDSLGESVAKSIVAAREEREFLSKEDVMKRTQLSKTLMDRLDRMGAMEGLDEGNQLTLF